MRDVPVQKGAESADVRGGPRGVREIFLKFSGSGQHEASARGACTCCDYARLYRLEHTKYESCR